MERLFALSRLLDGYGALLTERQRSIMRQYCDENLTLAEIAERENISRQGVRDAISRGEQQLKGMEAAIGLIKKQDLQEHELRTLALRLQDARLSEEANAILNDGFQRLREIWEDEDGI